jgi:BMFP domain-containing protein YqiC
MDQRVEDLVRRLLEVLPRGFESVSRDVETNFRAVLQANLAKLDLLARDEFLAQTKVLERTRARLEVLEQRLAELEAAQSSENRGG